MPPSRVYVFKFLTNSATLQYQVVFPKKVYKRACLSTPRQLQVSEGRAQRGCKGDTVSKAEQQPHCPWQTTCWPPAPGRSPRCHQGEGSQQDVREAPALSPASPLSVLTRATLPSHLLSLHKYLAGFHLVKGSRALGWIYLYFNR